MAERPWSDEPERPILVTGAHRSGTTWVGKMLALAPGRRLRARAVQPAHRAGDQRRAVRPLLRLRHRRERGAATSRSSSGRCASTTTSAASSRAIRSPRDALHSARDLAAFARARATHARPLVKDPIALFSAEWLAERFGMDVVVTIRHPAGFASSLQRLGWTHDFGEFLEDERLMRDHLAAFEDEIRAQAAEPGGRARAGDPALAHLLLGSSTATGERHPGLDVRPPRGPLARRRCPAFERLYERLGLELTDARPPRDRARQRRDEPGRGRAPSTASGSTAAPTSPAGARGSSAGADRAHPRGHARRLAALLRRRGLVAEPARAPRPARSVSAAPERRILVAPAPERRRALAPPRRRSRSASPSSPKNRRTAATPATGSPQRSSKRRRR